MRTFGTARAAVLGNDPDLVDQLRPPATPIDEPLWQLPLVRAYRQQLDSKIADIKNMGGENAGTITAGLFLEEFVGGHPVRPPRHLRTDDDATATTVAIDRRTGFGDAAAGRVRPRLPPARR